MISHDSSLIKVLQNICETQKMFAMRYCAGLNFCFLCLVSLVLHEVTVNL